MDKQFNAKEIERGWQCIFLTIFNFLKEDWGVKELVVVYPNGTTLVNLVKWGSVIDGREEWKCTFFIAGINSAFAVSFLHSSSSFWEYLGNCRGRQRTRAAFLREVNLVDFRLKSIIKGVNEESPKGIPKILSNAAPGKDQFKLL